MSHDEEERRISKTEGEVLWVAEVQRRERELREGEAKHRPAEKVLKELRKEFTK